MNHVNKIELGEDRFHTIGSTLFDLYMYRHRFDDFPVIPGYVFDNKTQSLSMKFSLCKKGTAYHIVTIPDSVDGGYIYETLFPIDASRVVGSFTEYDLFHVYNVDDSMEYFRYELLGYIQPEFSRR